MLTIPKEVIDLFSNPATVKILSSVGKDGQPHAVVCGSLIAATPDMIIVGEILMKRTAENIKNNDKACILIVNGMTSYGIDVKVTGRVSEGPMLQTMNENLAKMKLKASAVWTFKPVAVFDESASPNAGKKIA